MNWFTRLVRCSFKGHDLHPVVKPGLIVLRCEACGYRSPGWKSPSPSWSSGSKEVHRFRPTSLR